MRVSLLFVFSGCFRDDNECENAEEEQDRYSMDEFFEEASVFFCESDAMCYSDIDCNDEDVVALYWIDLFGLDASYKYTNYDVCQAHLCMDALKSAKTECDNYWGIIYDDIFQNECGEYKTYELQ